MKFRFDIIIGIGDGAHTQNSSTNSLIPIEYIHQQTF